MWIVNIKKGQQTHLFFGHGATQEAFEKRDFGTINELFYDKRMKTDTLINPHYYHGNLISCKLFVRWNKTSW